MTDAASDPNGTTRLRRTFDWGILFVTDSDETGLPDFDLAKTVDTTPCAMSIAVRHAQDVEVDNEPFLVSVAVHVSAEPPPLAHLTFNGVIDFPSGRLEIGDADETQTIQLSPGRWSVAVEAVPADHPEQVDIWLDRLVSTAGYAQHDS
jgi:hypothetical protein